ncbi:MAG: ATP-binding protein [Spirochaetia bacterium]
MRIKSRFLGLIFIAAVIVPSILLAVLSTRAAGREEAFVEKQLATTLLAEVTQTAGLANAEIARVVEELRAGLDVPAGADYGSTLRQWQKARPLVKVPFLLSPRYGILWPRPGGPLSPSEKLFLRLNGDFLSDKTATTVLQNIALRYRQEILAETRRSDEKAKTAASPPRGAAARESPARSLGQSIAPDDSAAASDTSSRQMALDAFAQNPEIQNKVYQEAREQGDTVSPRVAQPLSKMAQNAAPAQQDADASAYGFAAGGAAASGAGTPAAPAASEARPRAEAAEEAPKEAEKMRLDDATLDREEMTVQKKDAPTTGRAAAPAPASAAGPATAAPVATSPAVAVPAGVEKPSAQKQQPQPKTQPQPQQQSQFVVTSRLLSQIASRGEYGLIPRFTADRLSFLFWKRLKDGRIAGCEIAPSPLRDRIAGVLEGTYTPVRIITILDESGAPLAAPPDSAGRNWRQPFVSREIGELLPRWEAAGYLTRPDSISSRARSSSLVIGILVLILFVSVAGGGTMVLTSVYGEVRLAQKKATFVTNVSHELKTPLTSISLFVELLRRKRQPDPAKRERYLSLIAAETERLTRLINNVLDFSSQERGVKRYSMKSVDAALVTAEIVETQRMRLESRGFTLACLSAEAPMPVRADPEALKQVVLNLLSNAEKYSPERKEIDVEVCRERWEGTGAMARIAIHVRDRGIGVAEQDRERIFREFFRVDDSLSSRVQGSGLGLTIARRIARDHGGDLVCAARQPGGSDFIVYLPEENST